MFADGLEKVREGFRDGLEMRFLLLNYCSTDIVLCECVWDCVRVEEMVGFSKGGFLVAALALLYLANGIPIWTEFSFQPTRVALSPF